MTTPSARRDTHWHVCTQCGQSVIPCTAPQDGDDHHCIDEARGLVPVVCENCEFDMDDAS